MDCSNVPLDAKKLDAHNALLSLIAQCQKELANLDRFDDYDSRMLIATADLKRSFDAALEAADSLEDAFNACNKAADEYEREADRERCAQCGEYNVHCTCDEESD